MRKFVAVAMALLLSASLVGCNASSDNPQQMSSNTPDMQTETPATEGITLPVAGEITLDMLMDSPESPEEDFLCYENEDGTMELVNYLGDDEVVVIPDTWKGKKITIIGSYVFANDSPVKAVRLSDSVATLMEGSFAMNEKLELVVCGSGLKEIGDGAFQLCTGLKEIVLNDGLEKLSSICLGGCTSMMSIEIPDSVTEIHFMAFMNCPEGFTIIGSKGSQAEQFATSEGIAFKGK